MLEIIFVILMILVFGDVLWIAIKAAWGLTKILLTIVFFPLILVGMVLGGLIHLALVILAAAAVFLFVQAILS